MQGLRVPFVRMSLALCAATIALGGFAACGEDEPDPISTQVDRATALLQQFVAEQQRQLQQAAQATSYGQAASTYQGYVATQQQAEQDLRALQSDQAWGDFYAARARHAQEMTRIFQEQMQRQAEAQRVYEERRYQELYEQEQQRLEQLEDPYP
jgi:hypothetical protein